MIRYDIKQLATGRRRRGTIVRLPAIRARLLPEYEYRKALRMILRELAKETRENIVPLAVREMERRNGLVDRASESWFDNLRTMALRLVGVARAMVDRVIRLEAQKHTDDFMAAAKKALGVDLMAVIRQEDLEDYLFNAGLRNAGLITGFTDDMVRRVQTLTMNAVVNGQSAKILKEQLKEAFEIGDRRAKLIARDQIGKLTSDLSRIRHEQAGIEKYEWSTSADERVRPRHSKLEGKVYAYGQPTDAEEGLPPGQPIQCRCVAIAIVEF